jgi:hypothetical protein
LVPKEVFMHNTVTIADIKRRGMSAIDDCLRAGPAHIVKRNKPAAVILSQADYQQLLNHKAQSVPGMTAVEWLLSHKITGQRSRADIDADLNSARAW